MWEVFGTLLDWGDGEYDIKLLSDDPTGYTGSKECEVCEKEGEWI